MRLALFNDYLPGVVNGDRIVDVSSAVGSEIMSLRYYDRMPAIIEAFDRLKDRMADAGSKGGVALNSVRLRAPVPRPSKILCGIGNFYENTQTPPRPLGLFLKAPSAILDPGGTVELPPLDASVFHHEAELALIIGKRTKRVSRANATDSIFGYTCFMDISARGVGMGVGFPDKSPDTFAPIGPWIVTRDEIPDPLKLQVRMWVDGQARHDYNLSDMEHPPAELIEWGSNVSTLEPGDVIACGTNHQGLGPVQDGDTVEIEIENIGRMSVKVHDELKRKWPKEIDREAAAFVRGIRTNPNIPRPKVFMPPEQRH